MKDSFLFKENYFMFIVSSVVHIQWPIKGQSQQDLKDTKAVLPDFVLFSWTCPDHTCSSLRKPDIVC